MRPMQSLPLPFSLLRRYRSASLALGANTWLVLAALFWTLSANRLFLGAALQGRSAAEPASWGFALGLLLLVFSLHLLLLGLLATRWTLKPLLVLLTVGTAFASYFMQAYGVFLDPSMLRNVWRSDAAEARELLSPALLLHLLLYAGLPLLVLSRLRLRSEPSWLRAAGRRLALLGLALLSALVSLMAIYQPFSSLMRNNKELRYLITPANYLWSGAAVAIGEARGAAHPRQPVGLDAAPGPSWAQRRKPLVLVLVVGETARDANWGLSGYARQTTPELAKLGVANLGPVVACGSNTEVSVPCMFSAVGRRDYDEARIRGQDSLLHVAARAGVAVQWRDNQSGCKGVCAGLPIEQVDAQNAPGLCAEGRCLDEGLVHDLDQRLRAAQGTQLWVLHMLGNHGPAYHRRYPREFAHFQPECRSDDLQQCTSQQIVNAYDNALLYTDHLLAHTIKQLKAQADTVDSLLIYVSDHGESLGEHGLFLHGLPYAIAPTVQTRVPMVAWASPGFAAGAGLVDDCLRRALQPQAQRPVSHDHLFHTVLGLLDVRSSVHEPAWDLSRGCRS